MDKRIENVSKGFENPNKGENFEELFEESMASSKVAEGKVVEGTVDEGDSIISQDTEIGKVLISKNYPFAIIKYTSDKFDFNSIFKIKNAKVKIIKPNWILN